MSQKANSYQLKKLESILEGLIFNSRWLLVPFYIGLILAITLLMIKFTKELLHFLPNVFTGEGSDTVIGILTLIDVTLVANLLLIIIFAGYENFVSKINTGDHEDRPEWMGYVNFSDLKIKVIGSIVAITAIELLKAFVNIEKFTNEQLSWKIGIHLTFVVSGVLFAVMDKVSGRHK